MATKVTKAEDPKEAMRAFHEIARKGYQDIGEFMVEFSQLQFTIRAALAGLLQLKGELFNAITAPYDFARLCIVTREVALFQLPADRRDEIVTTFKACLALNTSRVRVAHGLLTHGDGTIESIHVSYELKAGTYFSKPGELKELCAESQRLMSAVLKIGGGSLVLK
jgi:hypothetical protein